MGGRDLETIRDSLREHVNALAVDIGPRTPLNDNSLVRAANYIHSVFEDAGLSVTEQAYQILCPVGDERYWNASQGGGGFCLLRCRRSLRHCPEHAGRR